METKFFETAEMVISKNNITAFKNAGRVLDFTGFPRKVL